jgi:cyclopropane fatty-acyl-phospholipid synthase-like methyltransferase
VKREKEWETMKLDHIDKGSTFDWGRASDDYAKYRDIYPDEFYRRILELGLCGEGKRVLDLGTGTGVLPRHLYKYGAKWTAADISENQIREAIRLSNGMDIEYIVSAAEEIDYPDGTFDTVLACMCFTYFDKDKLLPRLYRMLKDDGRFCIMSMVWLPHESEIAMGSERLVLKYNPAWSGAGFTRTIFEGNSLPSGYKMTLDKGFGVDTAFAFDISLPFTRESWHGRMKACRGIGASSLTGEQIKTWQEEHIRFLLGQPEKFDILHSAVFCSLKKI